MNRWRVPLVGLLAWLAVVVVGSTAVWWVISSVGEDLGPEPSASRAVPGIDAGRSPGRPSGSSGSPASPTGPASPAGSTSPAGPTPPTARSSPSGRPSGPPPSASSSPSGTTAATTHQQTWSGRGGYVTVRCQGARAGLVAAQPDPGYAVAVSDRGPERVEVSFAGRTEDDGRRVEVRAACVGGRPSYQVSTGEGGD